MSCCDAGFDDIVPDHDCPDCGWPLDVDGDPIDDCSYSPIDCDTCGCRPCDGSC
jgi:hypothetical protein